MGGRRWEKRGGRMEKCEWEEGEGRKNGREDKRKVCINNANTQTILIFSKC